MEGAHDFRFGSFRLDLQNERLWRGTEAIRLRPKSFAVLGYLVAPPDRVVTKDELLQAVWPDTAVSEAALTVCLHELRQALGETAQAPQCIATVHRRGYRWIGQLAAADQPPAAPPATQPLSPPPLLIGREAALGQLYSWFERARRATALTPRLEPHEVLGDILFYLGEYAAARTHLEQEIAFIDPAVQRALALRHGEASGVWCLAMAANTLWCLGSPAQAMRRCQEALALAQELEHPYSLAMAQHYAALLHHRCREVRAVQAQAEALLALATAQGFPLMEGLGTCWRGWVLAMQGQGEAGLAQIREGMTAVLATGQTLARPLCLVLLAEAAGHAGQVEEGLGLLAEALMAFEASGRGDLRVEAYRLQGTLLLRQAVPDAVQVEACFHQALAIARQQQAKSWELRAALSLSRLWQLQGKQEGARALLVPLYGWFTEGFDTADLREVNALLDELGA
jgi:DNA-binding winged helix-turn-helix (wHTH) protein/predicted ATPase